MSSDHIPEILACLDASGCSKHIDYAATADHVYETLAAIGGEDQRTAGLALWFITQGCKAALSYGIHLLQRLANAGLTSAMHNLGLEKLSGKANARDYAGANALFCRVLASEQQDARLQAEAMSALADSYRLGRAMPVDMAAALELYINAAGLGMGRAAFNAGLIFDNGRQGENSAPDFQQAAHFYEVATDLGYVPARTNLGILHAAELVAHPDREHGLALLRTAIAAGDEVAGVALAVFETTADAAQSGTNRP
jgi:hypothetical protein